MSLVAWRLSFAFRCRRGVFPLFYSTPEILPRFWPATLDRPTLEAGQTNVMKSRGFQILPRIVFSGLFIGGRRFYSAKKLRNLTATIALISSWSAQVSEGFQ